MEELGIFMRILHHQLLLPIQYQLVHSQHNQQEQKEEVSTLTVTN